MKTNRELLIDIIESLNWEQSLNNTNILVEVTEGMVTLSGTVRSYTEKSLAEDTVKKIAGVKAIVEKLQVQFNNDDEKSDSEIAIEVLNAFKANKDIPFEQLQIEIEDGHLTLSGKLKWNHQKQAAQKIAGNVAGIKVLTNSIEIETDGVDEVEKAEIEQAIERNWAMNNQDIQVYVSNNNVTLHGTVHSFYEKEEAERMAWNAPGVWTVNNELIIDYNEQ